MSIFVILPHQLYEIKYLDSSYQYVLYEHPHYFESYNYNKKKIILHRGSMRYYYEYLKENGFSVRYIGFNDSFDIPIYTLFDPIDRIKLYGKSTIVPSPNFLFSDEMCTQYREKTEHFLFNAFYMWGKKILGIIPDIKSQDKENRKRLPDDIRIPPVPSNDKDLKYIEEAIRYTKRHFGKNYGNVDDFIFPLTHTTAKRWLQHFIRYKLTNFGKYQDAISTENGTLFHSLLSSSINIGLLQPRDIIDKVLEYKIPINSLEGYIRQLFWREYQRYCYQYCDFSTNYFGNRKKLTVDWYNGTLGIEPIDDCIKKAFNTGYLHHIERLMIIGNAMNLHGISPKEGFRWFMEFSCDSYEWVMHQNVYDMVFFVTGGMTMRRPYISSSNYIYQMSNYPKGEWCDKWDQLYHEFINKNKKKLLKFRYYFHGI